MVMAADVMSFGRERVQQQLLNLQQAESSDECRSTGRIA